MDFTEKVFFPPPCFYQLGFNFGFNFYNLPNIRACLLYVFALRYCFFKLLVYYPLRGEYKISRDRARLSRFDSRKSENEPIWSLSNLFFFFSFHSSKRGRYPAEAADKLFQHAGAVQTHEVSTIYNIRVRSHLKEVEGRRIGSIDSEGGKLKNLARFIIVGANFSKLYIFPWNKIQGRGQLKLSLVDTILMLPMRYEITSETTWIIFLTSIRDRRNSWGCQRITRPLSLLLEKRKLNETKKWEGRRESLKETIKKLFLR